jgi:hypothetical protein
MCKSMTEVENTHFTVIYQIFALPRAGTAWERAAAIHLQS